jgi:hypothetical protein
MTAGDLIYLPPEWWYRVEHRSSTLTAAGNFCGFAQAKAALAEAQCSNSVRRDEWVRTWTEILAQQTGGSGL